MFGFGKEEKSLDKSRMLAANATLEAIEVLLEERGARWLDVAVSLRPLTGQDDLRVTYYKATVRGHFVKNEGAGSYSAVAEITVLVYRDGRDPKIHDSHHLLIFAGSHRVKWTPKKVEVEFDNPFGDSWWRSSDDLKRLDELDLPVRLENYLYALRIRTLGHLKQWKRGQIVADMDDVSLRAALDIAVENLGVKLKAED